MGISAKDYNYTNILKPFSGLLKYFWWQKHSANDSTLFIWRKRIFATIFICTALMAAFTLIRNIQYAIQIEQWLNATIYTLSYLVLLTIVAVPWIPFKVRAWTGLLMFYGVGIASLLALGPVASGRLFLFAFSILAGLLLGLKAGIISLLLNIITFFLIGLLLSTGQLHWPHITVYVSGKWAAAGYTFFFLNTVITVSVGVLVNALERNLQKEQSLSKQLKSSNAKLASENNERRQAEMSLRHSENRFRIVSKLTSDLSYAFSVAPDNTFNLEWVTGATSRITGFNAHELSEMGVWTNLVHKNDKPLFLKQRTQLLSGESKVVEYRILSKSGEMRWLRDYGHPVWSEEQKRVIKIYGAMQDITTRKKSEKALRESKEKYKTLTNNIHIGIYRNTLGPEGHFLEANPAMLEMFGLKNRRDLLGLSVADLYQNPSDRKKFNEKMIQNGFVRNEELQLRKYNGDPMICSVSAVAIKNEKGDIQYYDGVIEDITERKKLELQLRKSQKMEAIGTLAGGVAHDLNNILSGVVSYPELLLMDIPEGSPLKKPLLTIQESGLKAAAIVQDLLTLARRNVSVTEVMNLNQLIDKYLNSPENAKILEYHPGVKVETNLQSKAFNIQGSPVHLSKTIMNLVSNAAEAMPSGGVIQITTENRFIDSPIRGYEDLKEGDYVKLTVSDNGVGISPDDIDQIFEPFYTKKTMGRSGTGLGMAVVWGTVKDHNGYIDVQSKLGEGTSFSLYFPMTRNELSEEKPTMLTDRYLGNGESILIVDDVKQQREIASSMLKKLGYNVSSVSSGEEAIVYMQENSADLLVLDMIMNPGIDGLQTYKNILKVNPRQKAIIASGYSESKQVKAAQQIGAGSYLKKPYSFEKIGLAVKAELQR